MPALLERRARAADVGLLRQERAHRVFGRVVAGDGDRLQEPARVGLEALDAQREEVGQARRRGGAVLAHEANDLLDVERRDAAARADDRRARARGRDDARNGRSLERRERTDRRALPLRIEVGGVRRDDEHGGERRLGDDVREGVSARAVDRLEIVDREDDAPPADAPVGAEERPAKRLGRREPSLVGVERRRARLALAEDLREARARLGARRGPVGDRSAVGRELRELRHRAAQRVVADLGPRRIGAHADDRVASDLRRVRDLAQQARFSDAGLARHAHRPEPGLRARAVLFDPREIVFAPEERKREHLARGLAVGLADLRRRLPVARARDVRERRRRREERSAALAAELLLGVVDRGALGTAVTPRLARRGLDLRHHLAEADGELFGALEAIARFFRERLQRDVDERLGDHAIRRDRRRVRRRLRQVHQDDLRGRLRLEGQPSRKELVENDADRVEVAARVERVAATLLGRHVLGRAAHDSGARDRRLRFLDLHLREAEVDDLHEVAAAAHRLEDDVLGLEVAVDDVEVMRFGERRERLSEHVDHAPERERPVLVRHAREVFAAQVLHDEVELAVVGLAEIDDRDRVRVVQSARRARLGDEARDRVLFAREVRVNDLHRDRATERRLLRAIHAAHAADADELEDHEPARQRAPDQRVVAVVLRDLADRKPAARAELVRRVTGAVALRARTHAGDGRLTRAFSRGNGSALFGR